MATPLAAGVSALIWSKYPQWAAVQVKEQLLTSADIIDGLSCNESYTGKLGAGRMNAFLAVSPDADNDGIPDAEDNCPANCNSQQLDADGDGIGDVCDTTPGCGGCSDVECEQEC